VSLSKGFVSVIEASSITTSVAAPDARTAA